MAKQNNLKNGVKFSSENQPNRANVVKGKQKASLLKSIASQIVKGGVKESLEPLAKYLGLEIDKIDLETVMHLKQMEKAIKEGDTQAYNSVMNRILGKPTEHVKLEDITIEKPKAINFYDK